MKNTKLIRVALGSMALCAASPAAEPVAPSPYEVIWDSPSVDSKGSMPIGNGDIGLNVWVEPSGDLCFLIGKTDAWDDSLPEGCVKATAVGTVGNGVVFNCAHGGVFPWLG